MVHTMVCFMLMQGMWPTLAETCKAAALLFIRKREPFMRRRNKGNPAEKTTPARQPGIFSFREPQEAGPLLGAASVTFQPPDVGANNFAAAIWITERGKFYATIMPYVSTNPWTGQTLDRYPSLSASELDDCLGLAEQAFKIWRRTPLETRCQALLVLAARLEQRRELLASLITVEMGKPIRESRAEVDKCAWCCRYYAEQAPLLLQPRQVETDARQSFVRADPAGVVLGIMPWNFPCWQVFRYAVPNLVLGNGVLLRHASSTGGCAQAIASLFETDAFPPGIFQNLYLEHDSVDNVMAHRAVSGVTLTGSETAGAAVAALAGRYLKKSVLELGGSNAFVVLQGADLDQAVADAVQARLVNAGQSCIAAKRFIVETPLYEAFARNFAEAMAAINVEDPMLEETRLGPLASRQAASHLDQQLQASLSAGAVLLAGGQVDDTRFAPTLLGEVMPGMRAFDEETFGPLATLTRARNPEHALELAHASRYGLGLSIYSNSAQEGLSLAAQVADGAVFLNAPVVSDPRLPFGGTKASGYGRELSREGLLEFANIKTVLLR
jgi:succinate-semialdehyde dehydrogenase/glutarate-semialdehyde dehydrogenase